MSVNAARRPLRAVISEPAEPFLYRIVWVLGQLLKRLTRQDWRHQDRLPADGGLVVVANHISNIDPVTLAHYLIWSGRWPRYLAKSSLWTVPVIKTVVTRCGQIPIERHSANATVGLNAAIEAARAGKCVVVYPEGTITRDQTGLWPMAFKTGAARIALEAGVPIVPVAQWGAQLIMPGRKAGLPRFFPRRTIVVQTGEALDLSDLGGRPVTHEHCRIATDRARTAVLALLSDLREEPVPTETAGATTE